MDQLTKECSGMACGDVACTTNPVLKRQVVCNKAHAVNDLELFLFTTNLRTINAGDRKPNADYIEVTSPTFGNFFFTLTPAPSPTSRDTDVKMCCPFFYVQKSDGSGGVVTNAKMATREFQFALDDVTVKVPMVVNTKKIQFKRVSRLLCRIPKVPKAKP